MIRLKTLPMFVLATVMAVNAVGFQQPDIVYVRFGAVGGLTGLNWADAVSSLPTPLVRGTTYYVADGDYAALTIDTPPDGAKAIRVKKATLVDHGTDVGWLPSYGDGTATFANVRVATHYVDLYGIRASTHISFRNINGELDPKATRFITAKNVRALYSSIVAQDVTITNSDFGGFNACDTTYPADVIQIFDDGKDEASSRIVIEGSDIHDISDNGNTCAGTAGAGRHVDCLQLLGGHDITIRRNRFYNCATSAIMGESFRDELDGLVVENNFIQNVIHPGVALNLSNAIHGTNHVRHNTITGSVATSGIGPGTINLTGNILTVTNCGAGVFDHNLFVGGITCGTNPRIGVPSFVFAPLPVYLNGKIPDYRLTKTDVVARDMGNKAAYPLRDIDDKARFLGAGPDLGAHEAGTGISAPTNFVVK